MYLLYTDSTPINCLLIISKGFHCENFGNTGLTCSYRTKIRLKIKAEKENNNKSEVMLVC